MEAISQLSVLEQDYEIKSTIEKERNRLLNFIRKRIPDPVEAEDLLHDVFFELIEAYRLLKPIDQTTSWLFAVARNKITDLFRKKKTISFSSMKSNELNDSSEPVLFPNLILESSDNAEDDLMRNMILHELEEALEELPEEQRWVFEQHEIEGLSFKKMSEITGDAVNTLISRKRYAVLTLRSHLRELYDDIINN